VPLLAVPLAPPSPPLLVVEPDVPPALVPLVGLPLVPLPDVALPAELPADIPLATKDPPDAMPLIAPVVPDVEPLPGAEPELTC
jgi:hypothetical protein